MSKLSIRKEGQAKLMPEFGGIALSSGNKKLPDTHLIFNLTSAKNCPSDALGMCAVSKICYAKKCERIRPEYLAKNLAIEKWLEVATEGEVYQLIALYIETASKPITHIRLCEAGDFKDQETVDKMSRIALAIERQYGVVTYAWSARTDLDFTNAHFILNGSSPEVKGAIRVFKAVSKEEFNNLPKGSMICGGSRGMNCRTCHICHQKKFKGTVYCLNH